MDATFCSGKKCGWGEGHVFIVFLSEDKTQVGVRWGEWHRPQKTVNLDTSKGWGWDRRDTSHTLLCVCFGVILTSKHLLRFYIYQK